MLAAMALGADGVQVGTRFAAARESSLHENFKNKIVGSKEGDTILTLKQLMPVRLMKNSFYSKVEEAENRGASVEELKQLLGHARAKRGMFEGDLEEGELEIGQVAAGIHEIQPAATILMQLREEYETARRKLCEK